MRLLTFSLITAGMILLSACGNTTRFPVSSVVPAADIKAVTKIDKNNNKVITVSAKNLASPERIDPSSKAYVVWSKSENDQDLRYLGQLQNENGENASFTTIAPDDIDEIVITAEPNGSVSKPTGTEISRAEINDPFTDTNESAAPMGEETVPATPETSPPTTEPGQPQDANYPFGRPDTLQQWRR